MLPVYIGNILTSIPVASNKQRFSVVPGINRQLIYYSNYKAVDLLDYSADDDTFSTEGTTEVLNLGTVAWTSELTDFDASKVWNKHNNGKFKFIKGTGLLNSTESEQLLKIEPYLPHSGSFANGSESNKSFTLKTQLPYLLSSDKYNLKVECKVNCNTESRMDTHITEAAFFYKKPSEPLDYYEPLKINEAKLNIDLIVNDNEFNNGKKYVYDLTNSFDESTGYWADKSDANNCTLSFISPIKINKDEEFERIGLNIINNEDVELASYSLNARTAEGKIIKNDFIIPLDFDISGNIDVIIYNYVYYPENDIWSMFTTIDSYASTDWKCSM